MVVGTHVEVHVVLAVVPFDALRVRIDTGRIVHPRCLELLVLLDLREDPGAGNDAVGLEQFHGIGGRHLARDDAHQIVFDADAVDGRDLAVLDDEFQVVREKLGLLAVPVEIDTDGDVVQLEGPFRARVFEIDLIVKISLEEDFAVFGRGRVGAGVIIAQEGVGRLEIEGEFGQGHHADGEDLLLAGQFFFHDRGFYGVKGYFADDFAQPRGVEFVKAVA